MTTKKEVAPTPAPDYERYIRLVNGERKIYGLKSVTAEMRGAMPASKHFVWPREGRTEAPDWEPSSRCGNGLHFLAWGEGGIDKLHIADDAIFIVADLHYEEGFVCLDDKVKVRSATVLFAGDRYEAAAFLMERGALSVPYGRATAGDRGTATAGYRGTATAGDRGTATAGYRGTATAGDRGTATAGYRGTATAGYRGTATAGENGTATAGAEGTATAGDAGTATAGYRGTATAGDRGTATAGYRGTATAGYRGTATAGYRGTATAGAEGTATAGAEGTATAGENGILIVKWWDNSTNRYRVTVGYVGEGGVKPYHLYGCTDDGTIVKRGKVPDDKLTPEQIKVRDAA